ncbi:MAG: ABC transporter permease [Lachnospiraceae bacterium]|nr:ABC transporter permease [Lachnospiraceae bacterium]
MNKNSGNASFFAKLKAWPLLLPVVSLILVMAVNIIHDAATGINPLSFFIITLNETTNSGSILYGRIIDILNRGSEVAILALGMTLVVSSSAGTDISVGSVMSLAASFCCMLLAGYGVSSTNELAVPLVVGVLGAFLMGALCGVFNGTLVAYLQIQPMVATLILYSAARAIGLLLCNDLIVYVRNPSFAYFGSFTGPIPTPIIIAAVCIAIVALMLSKTSLGMYIQSVGINSKASRIAGLNSKRIIFMTYVICGLFAGVAGLVNSSRITSADSNNVGLYYEMDAILAVALGGNSLGGGKFNLAGSIIGAYTIQAITTTLYALGVSTDQAPVFKAIIVILIVAIQSAPLRAYFRKRSAAKALAGREAAKA